MELLRLVHSPIKTQYTSYILSLGTSSLIIQNILVFVAIYYDKYVAYGEMTKFLKELFDALQHLPSYSLIELEKLIYTVPWRNISFEIDIDRNLAFKQLAVKEHKFAPISPINRYLTIDPKNYDLISKSFVSAAGYSLPINEIAKIPFFANIVDDYYSIDDFILASELFQSTQGLTSEEILTSPFVYLTHAINPEGIISDIMESESLYTPAMLGHVRDDQYPGIYFYPNNVDAKDAYKNMGLDVIFVFSLALLKRKAWHINRDEYYGNISQTTWDYKTLPDYLRSHYTGQFFGEIVMHDPVPFDFLECILIGDNFQEREPEIYEETMNVLNQYDYPVMKFSEFKTLPIYKRVKNLYLNDTMAKQQPNFCYTNQGSDQTIDVSMKNIKYTLLNCGYTKPQVANYLKTKSKPELMNLIQAAIKSGNRYEAMHHPPY